MLLANIGAVEPVVGGVMDPTPDGLVTSFTAPGGVIFEYDPATGRQPAVYINGVRMLEGASNDYVVSESGGAGSGFDTFTFVYPPRVGDNLVIDFTPV